ncbi:Rv3654c family TadE-like protein [Mycobacterium sp. MS1601]|uniref:Rv3654c family TadE-like protein n=1 Tax=Mycobacterium sp. MS1601 TaxID=1936029 RepID=UPI001F2E3384|nr:Rv3654c family TadE-like protein [Mycobacterium sp. MS1601]
MMTAVLIAVTVGVACLGAAVVARHRAQAAADLASLAAALWLVEGRTHSCAAAEAVADAMRARTVACAVEGTDVTVAVTVPVRLGRWGTGQAEASARAGPT